MPTCSSCAAEHPSFAKFCPKCGKKCPRKVPRLPTRKPPAIPTSTAPSEAKATHSTTAPPPLPPPSFLSDPTVAGNPSARVKLSSDTDPAGLVSPEAPTRDQARSTAAEQQESVPAGGAGPTMIARPPAPPTVVPPPSDASKAQEKTEKALRIRKKVAQEILSTERTYIKALDLVVEKFLNPLQKAAAGGDKIISQQDIQMVFSVIGIIRDLNKKFVADLAPLIESYTLETRIGKTILDFAPYFKMYTQYVNSHENDRVQKYMRKLDSKAPNTPFKTFCYDVCKTEMCLPLPALLITPVQRIPRYRLLVAEYLKHTEPCHADYGDLKAALEKIKDTATKVNEAVRRQQQRQVVVDLEGKFTSNPNFVTPSRIFKFQGPLMKKCRADDRKYTFFLFNDLFVYGKRVGDGRYTLHKKIPINQKFRMEDAKAAENPFSFQVVNSVKSFVVYAESQAEKDRWMGEINSVLQERAQGIAQGDASHVAPIWESDRKKTCQRQQKPDGSHCGTKFSLLKRRHHCRICGVLCCGDCSPYSVYLTAESKKKERSCTACIRDVIQKVAKNSGLYREDALPPPALTSAATSGSFRGLDQSVNPLHGAALAHTKSSSLGTSTAGSVPRVLTTSTSSISVSVPPAPPKRS